MTTQRLLPTTVRYSIRPLKIYALHVSLFILLIGALYSQASAQIRLSELEPNRLAQGATEELTLFGDLFEEGMTLSFSGEGVAVQEVIMITQGQDAGDGRGDRVTFSVSVTPDAELAPRNLTVSMPGQNDMTKYSALTIVAGNGMAGTPTDPMGGNDDPVDPNDPMMNTPNPDPMNDGSDNPLYSDLPPRQDGQINSITQASPPIGELGGQVNLWISGREFPSDIEVKFNTPEIGQAYSENQPIPPQIIRNTSDTNGSLDGILYFIRISPTAPLGPVDITLSSASTGSTLTAQRIFEIVPRGEGLNEQIMGSDDLESVSGASPLAIRAGRNTALWVWGRGFNAQSRIEFNNPSIEFVRPSVPVIQAQNMPGFDGMQNFLLPAAEALPGPVNVTITNPNGTREVGMGLFSVVPASGNASGAPTTPQGEISGIQENCLMDDYETSVIEVSAVTPNEVMRGETTEIEIIGSGFACGATVMLRGGGIEKIGQEIFSRDPINPNLTFFRMRIAVAPDAKLGSRTVIVMNLNGSIKSKDALTVIEEQRVAGAACSTSTASSTPPLIFWIAVLFGLYRKFRDDRLRWFFSLTL